MAEPTRLDLKIVRGDTWTTNLSLTIDGVKQDIQGAIVYLTVRKNRWSRTALLQDVTNIATGTPIYTQEIELSSANSESIRAGTFFWDLKIVETSGRETTFWRGKYVSIQGLARQ